MPKATSSIDKNKALLEKKNAEIRKLKAANAKLEKADSIHKKEHADLLKENKTLCKHLNELTDGGADTPETGVMPSLVTPSGHTCQAKLIMRVMTQKEITIVKEAFAQLASVGVNFTQNLKPIATSPGQMDLWKVTWVFDSTLQGAVLEFIRFLKDNPAKINGMVPLVKYCENMQEMGLSDYMVEEFKKIAQAANNLHNMNK